MIGPDLAAYRGALSAVAEMLLGAGMAPPIGYRAPRRPEKRKRNPKAAAQSAQRKARRITRRASR